jgi:hypothetical protein
MSLDGEIRVRRDQSSITGSIMATMGVLFRKALIAATGNIIRAGR